MKKQLQRSKVPAIGFRGEYYEHGNNVAAGKCGGKRGNDKVGPLRGTPNGKHRRRAGSAKGGSGGGIRLTP